MPALERTLLYTDPSGGKLYQGNRYDVANIANEYYSLVVLAAYDFQPQILTPEQDETTPPPEHEIYDAEPELNRVITTCPPGEIIRVPLTEPTVEEAEQIGHTHRPYVHAIAMQAICRLKSGKPVLVSCWGGVNRSSFVAAAILWHLKQGPMDKIIDRLVEERCFSCPGLMEILRDAEKRWTEFAAQRELKNKRGK